MTIYERIRQCRLNKGMTQSEIAEIMGYTDRSTIAKIETGKVDLFISKVSEFAKVFNVSPMYLMGWTVDAKLEDLGEVFRELNEEGQDKVFDYARDLVASGQYKKHDFNDMVEEA